MSTNCTLATSHYNNHSSTKLYVLGIPLTLNTLTLIKWRDSRGCEQKFRLINMVSADWKKFGRILCQHTNLLKAWELEYAKNAGYCWSKVMEHWLDEDDTSSYPTTWIGLFTLLEDAEYTEVAIKMEAALSSILPPPPPPPPPSVSLPGRDHSQRTNLNPQLQSDIEVTPLSTDLFLKFLTFSVDYFGTKF